MTELHDILTLLSIIGKIRENEKIASNNGTKFITIEQKGIMQCVYRFMRGENRRKNLEAIHSIFQRAVILLETKVRKGEHRDAGMLLQFMDIASCGLKKLETTYENDPITVSKIQIMCQSVSNLISECTDILKIKKK